MAECVRQNWISGGPRVAEFERVFAASHGRLYGAACHSGTGALKIALRALGIGPGHRVLCPTLTMVAVPNAILHVGATPVFADSEEITGNMDVDAAMGLAGRCDVAIVPHLYGMPSEAARVLKGDHRLVIEDCAEAHFATYADGRSVGTVGDLACFSFFANKIITTGEGGMTLTSSQDLHRDLQGLAAHAFTPGQHFCHQSLAYGDRMSDLHAAIGLCQMRAKDELLRARRKVFYWYICNLTHKPAWYRMPRFTEGMAHWVFPVLALDECSRDRARHSLADAGVETRTYFHPMHMQKHLREFILPGQKFPVAEDLASRGLYLPLWPGMSGDDVDYVCDHLVNGLR